MNSEVSSSSAFAATWREMRRGLPVALTAALGVSVGLVGLSIYTLPFFIEPLGAEFGWSRREVLGAATAFTIGLIATGPLAGRLIDRVGVAKVIPASIGLFCLGWLLLTQMTGSLWSLYGGYVLIAALGAGTAYIAYARSITRWFDAARGMALGLTMSGPGVTAAIVPLVLPGVIAQYGWQGGYAALALASLLPLPLVLVFLRRDPPQAHDGDRRTQEGPREEPGLTLLEAQRTRQFWFLFLALVLGASAVIGTHLNMVSMISDRGAPETAAGASALFGVAIIVGRLGVGVLLDRFPGGRVGAVLFGSAAIAMLIFQYSPIAWVPIAAIMLGLAAGSESDVCGYLTSRYFGLKAYSEIFGWMFSAMAIGLAIGPLLGSWAHEASGDYHVWLIGAAVASLAAAALLASLGDYRKLDGGGAAPQ